jgi:mannitol-specific phosphotransferase system IIBC component
VAVAAAVSFAVGSMLLGFGRIEHEEDAEADLAAAEAAVKESKPTRPAASPEEDTTPADGSGTTARSGHTARPDHTDVEV